MKNLFLRFCLLFPCLIEAQLVVQNTLTPAQLVNNVLLGPGVVAFNVQYTGAAQAIGFFDGVNSNIGLKSGIILSTGKTVDAVGPNNTTSITTINNTPGNVTLTQLAGTQTRDAAILEFDFIPSSDTVTFNYVFASEEYYEGVCTPYNDIFAFLINGPGIVGTKNLALIPGSNRPVSISSVNGGILGDPIYSPSASYTYCVLTNTLYYVDNTFPQGQTVQYDGFTKVLTAKSAVIPCQTYHIRMAIADGGNDNTWDSGVFLEAGSFNTRYLTVNNKPIYSGGIIDSSAVEGCGRGIISFKRYDSIPYSRTLNYTLSGTANPNDYVISAPNVHFNPGQDSIVITIDPIKDNIPEGIETLSLTLIPDFIVCDGWVIPGGSMRFTDYSEFNAHITKTNSGNCPYDSSRFFISIDSNAVENNSYQINWTLNNQNYTQNPISVYVVDGNAAQVSVKDVCHYEKKLPFTLSYDCDIVIPNVITPNYDSVNDVFFIKDLAHYGICRLSVFNRWGGLIYDNTNYDNSWSPKGIDNGTYFYILEFESAKKFKGVVSVFH